MNDYLGNLKVMGQDEDKNFYVQIEIVRSGPNRNGWDFQNMEKLSKTFLGTPLLCAYVGRQVGDGHNFREATLPDGEKIYDFTGPTAERIVGSISDDPDDLWTEEREDGTWAIAKGKIWRFYNRQLADKIAQQGSMAVSAEIETFGGYTNDEGVEVYDRWEGLGVTILHESVPPAVPGANIQAIRAMSEEFKEMKFKAASYHPEVSEEQGQTDHESEEKTLRKGVRKHMSLNRLEADRLAPKFPGYHIVGLSEDSKAVILMSNSFGLYSYRFNEEFGEEVVESAIHPVTNITLMCGSEEDGVDADLNEIIKTMSGTISEQTSTISNLNAQITTLNEKCEKMATAEHDRRIDMVKASVHKALEDIAESGDSAEYCNNEAADIEANAEAYSQMENAEGKFCGDQRAYDDLMTAYGKKVMNQRKELKRKTQAQYAWENEPKDNGEDGNGIAGLLAYVNGR